MTARCVFSCGGRHPPRQTPHASGLDPDCDVPVMHARRRTALPANSAIHQFRRPLHVAGALRDELHVSTHKPTVRGPAYVATGRSTAWSRGSSTRATYDVAGPILIGWTSSLWIRA